MAVDDKWIDQVVEQMLPERSSLRMEEDHVANDKCPKELLANS